LSVLVLGVPRGCRVTGALIYPPVEEASSFFDAAGARGGVMRIENLLGADLTARGLTLAVAESCTGGLVGHRITSAPGSSSYFLGGVISYSNEAKEQLLGVPRRVLRVLGAVSPDTAESMAQGVRRCFGSSLGLAITGIAGPSGGTPAKPVGLTYVSLASESGLITREFIFPGDRTAVKRKASQAALAMVRDYLARP